MNYSLGSTFTEQGLVITGMTITHTATRYDEVPAHAAILREAQRRVAPSPALSEQLQFVSRVAEAEIVNYLSYSSSINLRSHKKKF